jgi:hypothetical protein
MAGGLLKCDADASFGSPNDAAPSLELIAWDIEYEVVGDIKRGHDIQGRPRLQKISYRAINRTAAKLNGSGFQYTAA